MKRPSSKKTFYDRLSTRITKATGSPYASITAMLIIIAWAVCGPVFGFSDTWQLVINTGTTIITFLMVFVIQQSQNKDTMALQLKLNELIASSDKSSNRLIDIEDLTEEELAVLKKFYVKLATLAKTENNLQCSHSLEEAEELQDEKMNHPRYKKQVVQKK